MNSMKDLYEGFKKAMKGSEQETPLCILKNFPELDKMRQEFDDQRKSLFDAQERIGKEHEKLKKAFWEKFEVALVQHEVITKELHETDPTLCIRNGVLFLKEGDDD